MKKVTAPVNTCVTDFMAGTKVDVGVVELQSGLQKKDLRRVTLKKDYRSGEDNLLQDFYVPCLTQSKVYLRATGFFHSAALAAAAKGIASLIKGGGFMKLIASPHLKEDDVKALLTAKQSRDEVLCNALLRELSDESIESALVRKRLECLSWLSAEGRLEVKIAVPKPDSGLDVNGIYHEKLGIFIDESEQAVAFSGSINETASGWICNFESFDVFVSWSADEIDRVKRKQKIFDDLWQNRTSGLDVFDLPQAVQHRLIRYRPSVAPTADPEEELLSSKAARDGTRRQLWHNQTEAIEAWKSNGYRGIWEMATGTGKTLAALEASKSGPKNIATIILVPTIALLQQWGKDILEFDNSAEVVACSSENPGWKMYLPLRLAPMREPGGPEDKTKRLYVLAVTQTAVGKAFQTAWIGFPSEKVQIIADEVHHLGADIYRRCFNLPADRRLGLSATPERGPWDESGTEAIIAFFGSIIYRYDIKKAVEDGILCHYEYYPFFAYLNEEEFVNFYELTKEIERESAISQMKSVEESDLIPSKKLHRLLEKRALIKKKAKDKIRVLQDILATSPPLPLLVFCEDQEQLGDIKKVLKKQSISFLIYTSEQSAWQREQVLAQFRNSGTKVLLAIRCLNEGLNVRECPACIIVASSTSTREFIQRRGRILRRYAGKVAKMYDIITIPLEAKGEQEMKVRETLVRQELSRVYLLVEASDNEWKVRKVIGEELAKFGLKRLALI